MVRSTASGSSFVRMVRPRAARNAPAPGLCRGGRSVVSSTKRWASGGAADRAIMVGDSATDIITARAAGLRVIARNSTFVYKGRSVDIREAARQLGVRYVLEGSVRKAGDRVRINAQLIVGRTGKHLWAERYDRDLADIFALQDEITEAVTIAIAPAIADAEQVDDGRPILRVGLNR